MIFDYVHKEAPGPITFKWLNYRLLQFIKGQVIQVYLSSIIMTKDDKTRGLANGAAVVGTATR